MSARLGSGLAITFLILFIGTGLCGCQSVVNTAPQLSASDIAASYRLESGDKIRVTVFNQTSLSGEFAVDGGGYVSLPLLGAHKAQDMTTHQLEESIARELTEKGYLVNPSVSIQMVEFRPYYILGEVSGPGQYPYVVNLTVTKAVAAAKGYTYRANTHRVFIQHSGENAESLYRLTPGTPVLPGDTIRIPERSF